MKYCKVTSLILLFLFASLSEAKIAKNKNIKSKSSHILSNNFVDKNLSKNIRFDEHVVNGKYQLPGQGLVTVENEKGIINVLSIRTDFADRIKNEEVRR